MSLISFVGVQQASKKGINPMLEPDELLKALVEGELQNGGGASVNP